MPEGPSIFLLREHVVPFVGQVVQHASGNCKTLDVPALAGQRVEAVRSWGKQLLIQFPSQRLRIHLMLFGSYRINERKDAVPRLRLQFGDCKELNFYSCSVQPLTAEQYGAYDWRLDVMSDTWDPACVRKLLRATPDALVCDALLDQTVFAGVGNIIKNELLFRVRIHPLSRMGAVPARKLRELVDQARQYSFDFLEWKKAYALREHWQVHNQKMCPRCHIALERAHLGNSHRRSFFCEICQRRYVDA
jgi:endonuclease-8